MRNSILAAALVVAAILPAGCRSRVKPVVTPSTADTQPVAQVVEAPSRDFVSPGAETPRPMSGAELNRAARDRGWIRDAFFEFDSMTLDTDARNALDVSARWLRDNQNARLVIEGHCDERGTEQYNLALGERRAATARQYLTVLGVDPARITHMSFGEEQPFAEGSSEEAWRQNRRAHLRLED
ncbi:MAG TPA: OmpA family protein [Thermoanaerobaculia bacterium]|nr:OmpA family protein [Thermoanaerobaculia bacterium]